MEIPTGPNIFRRRGAQGFGGTGIPGSASGTALAVIHRLAERLSHRSRSTFSPRKRRGVPKTERLVLGAAILVVILHVGCFLVEAKSSGPRARGTTLCGRYSLPADLMNKPFRFAGETVPFQRPDVGDRVRNELNFLLLDARAALTSWITQTQQFAWIFEETLNREGVPRDFLLFAPVISGLSLQAAPRISGAGWWGLDKPCDSNEGVSMSVDAWRDDRLDLELSTACFAGRIKRIRKDLGDESWLMAAAAYITSTKTIAERAKQWKSQSFWDIPLPESAEELVVRWIAFAIIFARPRDYGLNAAEVPPLIFDNVTGIVLAKDLPVAEIARMTETPPRKILELNPKLKPSAGKIPARVKGRNVTHSIHTPRGKGWVLVNKLKQAGYLAQKP